MELLGVILGFVGILFTALIMLGLYSPLRDRIGAAFTIPAFMVWSFAGALLVNALLTNSTLNALIGGVGMILLIGGTLYEVNKEDKKQKLTTHKGESLPVLDLTAGTIFFGLIALGLVGTGVFL
jgi:FtsH-binding integral membrane protein